MIKVLLAGLSSMIMCGCAKIEPHTPNQTTTDMHERIIMEEHGMKVATDVPRLTNAGVTQRNIVRFEDDDAICYHSSSGENTMSCIPKVKK